MVLAAVCGRIRGSYTVSIRESTVAPINARVNSAAGLLLKGELYTLSFRVQTSSSMLAGQALVLRSYSSVFGDLLFPTC